jgi:hypothetical protein
MCAQNSNHCLLMPDWVRSLDLVMWSLDLSMPYIYTYEDSIDELLPVVSFVSAHQLELYG